MAYYTAAELREQAGGVTKSAARAELSHAAETPSVSHDIFLSHSIKDEILVLGLRNALMRMGLTVYVDWLDDPALDWTTIAPTTAVTLRQRMRSCRAMVYATSSNAAASRWMPWELGYLDGRHEQSKVAICPIAAGAGSSRGRSISASTSAWSRWSIKEECSLRAQSFGHRGRVVALVRRWS